MKKGFTLVELLAVIVILAIILAIAIPGISNVINSATKGAFASDAKLVLTTINYKMMELDSFDMLSVNETNIESLLKLSADNYQSIKISTYKGKPYVVIQGKNKWNGLVVYGTASEMNVTDSSNYNTVISRMGYDDTKGVNEPKLVTGMTPIKWNGTTWVNTVASDADWYNYNTTDKKWANARTADGSMWVWIPRYIYKISSGWHTSTAGTIDIQFSKGNDDNWNSSIIGNIDTGITSNASNNKWTNHPAFDFGTTKLTGIWVAKFEATAAEGVATTSTTCNTADNVITKNVKIVPNVSSWRCITISRAFTVSRNMETTATYGWGTSGTNIDTHLIKRSEWGAVAYLSKSNYGQDTNEIWINPSDTYTTGCAGDSLNSAQTTGCLRAYDSTNGVKASTTGNIYGVYDLNGGASEFSSAYLDTNNSSLSTGTDVVNADDKYKNKYAIGSVDNAANNYIAAINQKGDAVYETSNSSADASSWFGDTSWMISSPIPFLACGGRSYNGATAGSFYFQVAYGAEEYVLSFRPVLLVNEGL